MNKTVKRTIWGTLFIAVVVLSFIGGQVSTAIVLGLFMFLGCLEFYRLFKKSDTYSPNSFIGSLGAVIIYAILVLQCLFPEKINASFLLIPILFLPLLILLFKNSSHSLNDLLITLFPWIYLSYSFYLMFAIFMYGEGGESFQWGYILGLFILVWTNDTMAYCTGVLFGKHKLVKKISPNKSWEGAIGGFIFTIIAGMVYSFILKEDFYFWVLAGVVVSPFSILGDLIESKLKRLTDVKDSGTILPGHGGILDRFDAVIFATPFFYVLLFIFQWI